VPTIAEVARRAGVSVSTVSHVVNGTQKVAPGTAHAVQAVIDAVGYRPNVLARSLKTASSRSVGIAISAIANPYFSDIICAVEAVRPPRDDGLPLGHPGRPSARARGCHCV
jgi:LacI family transcriptional regulator